MRMRALSSSSRIPRALLAVDPASGQAPSAVYVQRASALTTTTGQCA